VCMYVCVCVCVMNTVIKEVGRQMMLEPLELELQMAVSHLM
jgi:bacterioferritin-associated ferredoxin